MLWHYTVMTNLHRILADGELRPAPIAGMKRVKPVVWFTTHSDWEATSNPFLPNEDGKLVRLNKDQTIALYGGLARIGVAEKVAPLAWKAFKEQSGILTRAAKRIYDEAVSLNVRPGEWRATFDKVPRGEWLAVEVWDDTAWVARPLVRGTE